MPKRPLEITPELEADIRAICADIALGSTLATATRRRNITESAWGNLRTASRDGRAPAWILELMCAARRLSIICRATATASRRATAITAQDEAALRSILGGIARGETVDQSCAHVGKTRRFYARWRALVAAGAAPGWVGEELAYAKRAARLRKSPHTAILLQQISRRNLPPPVEEHRPLEARQWRIDLAWPTLRVGIEIQGGAFSGGRHVRGKGYEADRHRNNTLVVAGWRLLEVTPRQIKAAEAIEWIADLLEGGAR